MYHLPTDVGVGSQKKCSKNINFCMKLPKISNEEKFFTHYTFMLNFFSRYNLSAKL